MSHTKYKVSVLQCHIPRERFIVDRSETQVVHPRAVQLGSASV